MHESGEVVSGVLRGKRRRRWAFSSHIIYLFISFRKTTPAKICQIILYISNGEGQSDRFVGESTSAKRL